MSPVFEAVQRFLLAPERNLGLLQAELAGQEGAEGVYRLAGVLEAWEVGRAGPADVAVLLRQIIRAAQHRLQIPSALWHSFQEIPCGLRVTTTTGNMVELEAETWVPSWLPDAASMDRLERRRTDPFAPGDGLLKAMTGWTHYQSLAQQVAVHTTLFAGPGSTTLVTLPTGAGKSLTILLPAWHESEGGRRRRGTTIIIVPTISLALDQERQAQQFFSASRDAAYRPMCLIGEMVETQRAIVRKGLSEGTLPLLYLAPEALLNSELQALCLTAAQHGLINRLVIDEVHLVESWGAGFRTDFQLLAAYRKQLLSASAGQVRTLLLSATLAEGSETLLRSLFGSPGPFHHIRANRLRPEPGYWFHTAPSRATRQERVIEALHHLPRPAILYVTRPDEAEAWVARLRYLGFHRLASFTGNTGSQDRRSLVHQWANNEIDLMVATSAFGLGVDKADVRTVIHAVLPENVDRYYQEVGRGGRDGWSSVSLVCTVPADEAAAFRMTSSARIRAEKAEQRWESMRRTAKASPSGRTDEWLIDTGTIPLYKPEMWAGRRNEEWNEHVLLLMQRADLIEITQSREGVEALAAAAQQPHYQATWRHIRLLDPDCLNHQAALLAKLEATRQQERARISQMLQEMSTMVAAYTSPSRAAYCLAYELAELYPQTVRACGSCAVCRARRSGPYAEPLPLYTTLDPLLASRAFLDGDIQHLLGERGVIHASWEGPRTPENLQTLDRLLIDLVGRGFQQIVLPSSLVAEGQWMRRLIEQLATHRGVPHRLLEEAALLQPLPIPLYPVPTVVLYPERDDAADRLYNALLAQGTITPLPAQVTIIHRSLYLPSQQKAYRQHVDGLWLTVEELQRHVATPTSFNFF